MTTAEEYLTLTADDRRRALNEALAHSAEALQRAAEIFAAMEAAHDDTSSIPQALRRALRAIAARTMLPQVWAQLDGVARNRVMRLPVSQQKEIVEGKRFAVLRNGAVEMLRVEEMTPREAMLLFDSEGRARTTDEQMLAARQNAHRRRVIVTTRHPASRHGVPVCLVDGKVTDSWRSMEVALSEIMMTKQAFADRCGVSPTALQLRKSTGLTAAQLNVLRDLVEDFGL